MGKVLDNAVEKIGVNEFISGEAFREEVDKTKDSSN